MEPVQDIIVDGVESHMRSKSTKMDVPSHLSSTIGHLWAWPTISIFNHSLKPNWIKCRSLSSKVLISCRPIIFSTTFPWVHARLPTVCRSTAVRTCTLACHICDPVLNGPWLGTLGGNPGKIYSESILYSLDTDSFENFLNCWASGKILINKLITLSLRVWSY